jgi:hypothetical protein
MSAAVLENWINQTLTDAEHLNIPGCILKPENKLPIFRYNIDRLTLSSYKGIHNDDIDKVYRGLFVHSVGFFQTVQQLLKRTNENKHMIIINIWKVFAILLEFCCRTDYRQMI